MNLAKNLSFVILFLSFSTYFNSAKAQENAEVVLTNALSQAKKENKKVLLIFHASWCGWCKKMDKNLENPEVAPYFSSNFVTTHLTIMEPPAKKNLENPGGNEVFERYGGNENMGIPFFVIITPDGKMEENSLNEKGENLGCPASEEEVASFIKKLEKTTKLKPDELEKIRKVFLVKK